ncbi:MAG: hypothetical protein CME63_05535 [Halobacteriovoraceae bacterium]|nr:hypothetical protein [Halobacteriovoraceae bacterium]|tara:strand:+ start:95787 stop:96647 length:861 start_codon:yes stop_codon:yes gene_type:complete
MLRSLKVGSLFVAVFSTVISPIFSSSLQAKKFEIPPLSESFHQWGTPSRSLLNPDKVKVVVWNILKAKEDGFVKEFKSFGSDTDIFMLQEVDNSEEFFQAYKAYPNHQIHFGTSFDYRRGLWGDRYLSGTAISSRVDALDSGMLRTKDLEPFVKTPKVVTWALFPVEGKKDLLSVNIHGLNMTSNKDFIKQLKDCEKVILAHDGPVIFAGDFNTSDMEKLNAMWTVVWRTKLKAVTFENDQRKRSRFSKIFIDHTLVRGVEVIDSEVYSSLESSDHKAMGVTFKVL